MPENKGPITPIPDEGYYTHNLLCNLHDRLYRGYGTGGVCAGLAMSGVQAFLAGKNTFKRFENLLEFIGENPTYFTDGTHEKIINEITQNRALAKQQIIADLTANNETIPANLSVETVLTPEQQRAIDLMALFDSIELYLNTPEHQEVFARKDINFQNVQEIAAIVQPMTLAEQSGFATAGQCQGIYDRRELVDYMELLDKFARSCDCDIALQLCSGEHMFAACYDNATQSWTFLDANELDRQATSQVPSPAILADYVSWGANLRRNVTPTGLTTLILVTGPNQEKVKLEFEKLQSSAEFTKLHTVTQENKNRKAFSRDAATGNASLPWLAAYNGDVKTLSELIKAKSDMLNEPFYGTTPIVRAMQAKSIDCVKAFLEAKNDDGKFIIDINLSNARLGRPPIIDAIMMHNIEAFKLLLEAKNVDGSPRLAIDNISQNHSMVNFAITHRNVACLMLLDERGVDMFVKSKSGDNIFAESKGASSVELLEKYGEDVIQFYLSLQAKNAMLSNVEKLLQSGSIDDSQLSQAKNTILDTFKNDHLVFLNPVELMNMLEKLAVIMPVTSLLDAENSSNINNNNLNSSHVDDTNELKYSGSMTLDADEDDEPEFTGGMTLDADEDDELYADNIASKTHTEMKLDSDEDDLSPYSNSEPDEADTEQQFNKIHCSTSSLMKGLSIKPETIKNNLNTVTIDKKSESKISDAQNAQNSFRNDIATSAPEEKNVNNLKRPRH